MTLGKRGFTLIELLVVISIIALLASIVLASLNTARDRARLAAAKQFSSTIDHVAGDQALGIWDFDECSGSTAVDRSGNGYTGTLYGSPTWSTDTPSGTGCSLLFNGSNYVTLANSSSIDMGQTFTISAWIKPNSSVTKWYDVWGGSSSDAGFGFNGTTMRFTKTNVVDASVATKPMSINEWHHVAAVYSNNTISYYIDGQEAGSFSFTQTFNPGAKRIGSRTTISGSFSGNIDAVKVFSKSLTAMEVKENFLAEKATFDLAAR